MRTLSAVSTGLEAVAAPALKNLKDVGGGEFDLIFRSKGIASQLHAILLGKFLPTFGIWGGVDKSPQSPTWRHHCLEVSEVLSSTE